MKGYYFNNTFCFAHYKVIFLILYLHREKLYFGDPLTSLEVNHSLYVITCILGLSMYHVYIWEKFYFIL